MRGKGENLRLPTVPLQQKSQLIVQWANGSACWEARYSTFVRSDGGRFDARSD